MYKRQGQPTEGTTTGLYDLDKLKVYDKYAMFLHGNNGLSPVSYTHLATTLSSHRPRKMWRTP